MSSLTGVPDIRWPAGHEPDGATVHVVNRGRSPAPPEALWAWLVRPDTWRTFYVNARRVRPQAGPWPQVTLGSRFSWITFGAPVTTTITEFEPFERLAWTGTGLGSAGHHAWLLTPDGAGGTRIVTEETQRGRAVAVLRPALRPAMHALHQRWVDSLAALAQTGRRP